MELGMMHASPTPAMRFGYIAAYRLCDEQPANGAS